jgi:hypothetical protein
MLKLSSNRQACHGFLAEAALNMPARTGAAVPNSSSGKVPMVSAATLVSSIAILAWM